MIKQKAIYNKQFNIIDYKEYHNNILILHEQFNDYGKLIYHNDSSGQWHEFKYNERGQQTYYTNHSGYWDKHVYNVLGNKTYYEESTGHWEKHQYDVLGSRIYSEDSSGYWKKFDSVGRMIDSGFHPFCYSGLDPNRIKVSYV